jgi:hypothetical protein
LVEIDPDINGAFQYPYLTSTMPLRSLEGSMRWRASIRIALLALSHLVSANASSALAQAGSTGGTIGKQDKSISGGTRTDEAGSSKGNPKPHRSATRPDDETATGKKGSSCGRVVGNWLWSNGVRVIVNQDYTTTQSDGASTRVTCADGVFTFAWPPTIVRMTLSSNGNRLSGASMWGTVSAQRQ